MTSLALTLRPLEFFLTQYKRVWRGSAITTVVTPVVYLLALGVGLGVFVDRSADLAGGIAKDREQRLGVGTGRHATCDLTQWLAVLA